MRCSDPITVIDLDDIVPTQGESRVSLDYAHSQLRVHVHFDEGNAIAARIVTLIFAGVVTVHYASAPGPCVLNLNCTGEHDIGSVIEYTKSEAADAWSAHFGWRIRHFFVYFLNENKRLDVFAKECGLES